MKSSRRRRRNLQAGKVVTAVSSAGDPIAMRKWVKGDLVDAAMGAGHPLMPDTGIAVGLARIARRGVRSNTVREMCGISFAVTKHLPEGVFAMRTTDRIIAYRDGKPVAFHPLQAEEMAG